MGGFGRAVRGHRADRDAIARIEKLDPELNAVIHPLFGKAREQVFEWLVGADLFFDEAKVHVVRAERVGGLLFLFALGLGRGLGLKAV